MSVQTRQQTPQADRNGRSAMTVANWLGRVLRLKLPPKQAARNDTAPAERRQRRATTASGAQVARPALAAAALAALTLSIAIVLGLRELGRAMLDVPDHLAPLSTSTLIPATVFSVIGNTVGFFVSFVLKPGRYSMHLFLGIGAAMTIAGIAIAMTQLPAASGTGPVITTLAVSLAPVLVIVPALLHLVRWTA